MLEAHVGRGILGFENMDILFKPHYEGFFIIYKISVRLEQIKNCQITKLQNMDNFQGHRNSNITIEQVIQMCRGLKFQNWGENKKQKLAIIMEFYQKSLKFGYEVIKLDRELYENFHHMRQNWTFMVANGARVPKHIKEYAEAKGFQ